MNKLSFIVINLLQCSLEKEQAHKNVNYDSKQGQDLQRLNGTGRKL